MRISLLTRSLLTSLAVGFAAGGCSDSTSSPTGINASSAPPATVDGSYHATKLAAKQGSSTTDLLAGGAQISLVLTSTATTTGTIVIPAAYSESGTEETLALDGTYTYDPGTGTVTFDQAADTFVRDMTWNAGGTKLHGTLDTGTYVLTATLDLGS
jgi:hypothetical protein